jgi:hypothetical protein
VTVRCAALEREPSRKRMASTPPSSSHIVPQYVGDWATKGRHK